MRRNVEEPRCLAPSVGDLGKICGNRLTPQNEHGGRPRLYCCDACRTRAHWARSLGRRAPIYDPVEKGFHSHAVRRRRA